MRRLLMLVPFIAALAVPATAAAVEPTRETVHVTNRLTSTCPNGDLIVGEFGITQERTTFYDSEGRPVRELWVATIDGTTTNLARANRCRTSVCASSTVTSSPERC